LSALSATRSSPVDVRYSLSLNINAERTLSPIDAKPMPRGRAAAVTWDRTMVPLTSPA
jgi:hypothetical protein